MHVYYSAAYVAAGHAFDTTRKARWVADSLQRRPLDGVTLVAPPADEEAQADTVRALRRVHSAAYIHAVRSGRPRSLAESQGFTWDAQLYPAVLASTGGVLAATRAVLGLGDSAADDDEGGGSLRPTAATAQPVWAVAGSLSSGLHHARAEGGAGFCTFNGLAAAARAALAAGHGPVLILDFDAHCGGGTHALIGGNAAITQIDVATNAFDAYTLTDAVGSAANGSSLELVRRADAYLSAVRRGLARAARRHAARPFALCLYNAGMDPHQACALGGLAGLGTPALAAREQLVFRWCAERGIPVVFVLAGGYTGQRLSEQQLVALHRLTLAAAAAQERAERETPRPPALAPLRAADAEDGTGAVAEEQTEEPRA